VFAGTAGSAKGDRVVERIVETGRGTGSWNPGQRIVEKQGRRQRSGMKDRAGREPGDAGQDEA
jgi:hypothetical protein